MILAAPQPQNRKNFDLAGRFAFYLRFLSELFSRKTVVTLDAAGTHA